MDGAPGRPTSVVRRFVTGVAAVAAASVWVQAIAYLLRLLTPDAPLAATEWTLAVAFATAVGVAFVPRTSAPLVAAVAGVLGVLFVGWRVPGSWVAALAVPMVAVGATAGARWLASRLPVGLEDGWARRRPLALLWAAVALVAVLQVGRLSAFVADRNIDYSLGTTNPFWYKHECLPAYLYAAELSARGEPDVYDPGHYPALTPDATPETRLTGMTVEDPFQYPPQFLLLPRLAIALTHDANLVRVAWYVLQASVFVAAYAALALWVGGAWGRTALWLLPAAFASFPMMFDFQYGQFHLVTVAMAIAAMVAFARRHLALGGLLLSAAVMIKIFPLVLVVVLAVRRRWREVWWTAGWGVAITLLALLVLGPAPFRAFFTLQLPRLASGSAFAFDEAWPELADLVVADNQGVFGLAVKLGASKSAAGTVARGFGILVLLFAVLLGRRLQGASRWTEAVALLGLLGLGSLTSNGAWGDYVPTTAIWILALVAAPASGNARWALPLTAIAVFQYFVIGTMPIGEWFDPKILIPLSAVGALGLLLLFAGAAAIAWRPVEEGPADPGDRTAATGSRA